VASRRNNVRYQHRRGARKMRLGRNYLVTPRGMPREEKKAGRWVGQSEKEIAEIFWSARVQKE